MQELALTHCTASQSTPENTPAVGGSRAGIEQSLNLMISAVRTQNSPAATLGLFVAQYLIHKSGPPLQGALRGVQTGLNILMNNTQDTTESFALLQQLGTVLQVDVPDILNRSPDRQQTLDAYIYTLRTIYDKSLAETASLKEEQKRLIGIQHDKRKTVIAIQHDLNLALQKQDYGVASAKQSDIINAKMEESTAETEVSQINSTITLFNNLNKIADKRLAAISANREVLIAGLTVVNVPGIDDLGILTKGNTRGSTDSTNIFGSPGN